MSRIAPLDPPYDPDVEAQLASMMPPGAPPILLFRTFAKNMSMAQAMRGWGGYELGRELSLSLREREIVIDRTTARCRCEYEWGVHVAFFAEAARLTESMIRSLVWGASVDECWETGRERLLIEAVDALHESSTISDGLSARLSEEFSEAELLDLFMLCGWYHAISFAANGAGVAREPRTPSFADYAPA